MRVGVAALVLLTDLLCLTTTTAFMVPPTPPTPPNSALSAGGVAEEKDQDTLKKAGKADPYAYARAVMKGLPRGIYDLEDLPPRSSPSQPYMDYTIPKIGAEYQSPEPAVVSAPAAPSPPKETPKRVLAAWSNSAPRAAYVATPPSPPTPPVTSWSTARRMVAANANTATRPAASNSRFRAKQARSRKEATPPAPFTPTAPTATAPGTSKIEFAPFRNTMTAQEYLLAHQAKKKRDEEMARAALMEEEVEVMVEEEEEEVVRAEEEWEEEEEVKIVEQQQEEQEQDLDLEEEEEEEEPETIEEQAYRLEERLVEVMGDEEASGSHVWPLVRALQKVGVRNHPEEYQERLWESPLYNGRWELWYTSRPSSPLFSGPSSLAPHVAGFTQTIDAQRKAVLYTTMYKITSWLPLLTREHVAKWSPSSTTTRHTLRQSAYALGRSMALRFGTKKVGGGPSLSTHPFYLPEEQREKEEESIVEECQYLGRHVKVCKLMPSGLKGEQVLAVFRRAPPKATIPTPSPPNLSLDFSLSISFSPILRAFTRILTKPLRVLIHLLAMVLGRYSTSNRPYTPAAQAYRAYSNH